MTKEASRTGRAVSACLKRKTIAFILSIVFFLQLALGSMPLRASADARETQALSEHSPFSDVSAVGNVWLNDHPSLPVALPGVSAQSAVLINGDTGEVLFRQNENVRLPMASTTKIMTALVAVEALPLHTMVKISAECVGIEGSSIYLTEGELLSLEDLLYALMLESANDAAIAIAVAVAGSVEAFAERMNEKALALGLSESHFTNPHGLDDEAHYTTAYELALIAKAALSHDELKAIMSTQRRTIPMKDGSGVRLLLNHNKLLRSYEGAIGVKTGFTKKSGRCLVSAACRDGLTLIAVTINDGNDWRDHTAMLDYGFSLYDTVELCPAGAYEAPLWVINGTSEYVVVKNTDSLTMALPKDRGDLRCVVEIPRFTYAPVKKGQVVGRLVFYEENPDGSQTELAEVPLYAQFEAASVIYKKSLLEKISDLLGF